MQLEYGAEIGRAIVNFDGPIVFLRRVSRYHGGAFVVFSGELNENMEVLALEGSFASVIGGGPAAAVVFAREVTARTATDPNRARARSPARRYPDDAAGARSRLNLAALARPYVRTSSARWPRSSNRCTTSSEPARWVRSTRSFRRLNCARASSRR